MYIMSQKSDTINVTWYDIFVLILFPVFNIVTMYATFMMEIIANKYTYIHWNVQLSYCLKYLVQYEHKENV